MSASLALARSALPAASPAVARSGLRDWAAAELSQLLDGVLDDAEGWLFEQAAAARNGMQQQRLYDSLQQLRRRRLELRQRLQEAVHGSTERAEQGAALAAGFGPGVRQARSLCLVEGDALEEQLAGERLIAACERRIGERFRGFTERSARLWGFAAEQTHRNPLGPLQIAIAFRDALAPLEGIGLDERLRLYALLETRLPAWCERLPLEFERRVPVGCLSAVALPVASAVAAVAKVTAAAATPVAEPPAAPAAAAAVAVAERRAANEPVDPQWYALREAFGEYLRQRQLDAGRAGSPALLAETAALLALDALQAAAPEALLADAEAPGLTERLRTAILAEAQRQGRAVAGCELARAEEQALVFIGMLFEAVLQQGCYRPQQRRQWRRLSIAFTKLALLDRRLLAGREHPARRLLDALVEASEGNAGASPAERDLQAQADALIEQIMAGFDRDGALFETLADGFEASLRQHRQRVALAEQRAAEAQRGRERLLAARAQAELHSQRLLAGCAVPEPVEQFFRGAFGHHLAVQWLRHGSHSEPVRATLELGQRLRDAVLLAGRGEGLAADCRPQLAAVLASHGEVGEAAEQTIESLYQALAPKAAVGTDAAAALPPIEIVLPPPPLAVEAAAAPSASGRPLREAAAADAQWPPAAERTPATVAGETAPAAAAFCVEQARRQLAELAVGAWVELRNGDGEALPAKLSWVSPISQARLFVNRRGARIGVFELDELVQLLADDRLRLRLGSGAFEQAMSQVLGQLTQPAVERRLPANRAAEAASTG